MTVSTLQLGALQNDGRCKILTLVWNYQRCLSKEKGRASEPQIGTSSGNFRCQASLSNSMDGAGTVVEIIRCKL